MASGARRRVAQTVERVSAMLSGRREMQPLDDPAAVEDRPGRLCGQEQLPAQPRDQRKRRQQLGAVLNPRIERLIELVTVLMNILQAQNERE